MADFGIFYFPTDRALHGLYEPDDRTSGPPAMSATEIAVASEQRGFESLFFPEHTHIPTPRKTVWAAGPKLPTEYWHTLDPFVALGAASAVTERIRLGTGVAILPQRDPITLAKEVASLDWLSGGRAILGVGGGWNAEEMENHGVQFSDRWKITREHVLAMKAIWNGDKPEFHGEFVDFDPLLSYPKPVQPEGPEVLVGAWSKWALERVVDYADGWMPIFSPGMIEPGDALDQLREIALRAERPFESISLSCFALNAGAGPPPSDWLRSLIDLGFQRLVLRVPSVDKDTALTILDEHAELVRELA